MTNAQRDCFPDRQNKEPLKSPIGRLAILTEMNGAVERILEFVESKFATERGKRQKNAGRIRNLRTSIIEELELEADTTELKTFGDQHKAIAKVNALIAE